MVYYYVKSSFIHCPLSEVAWQFCNCDPTCAKIIQGVAIEFFINTTILSVFISVYFGGKRMRTCEMCFRWIFVLPTYVDKFVGVLTQMLWVTRHQIWKDVDFGPVFTCLPIRGRMICTWNKHLENDNFSIYYSRMKVKYDISSWKHFSKINLHSVFAFIVCL